METWWGNSFGGGDDGDGDGAGGVSGGQNGNFTNNAWDIWDNSTTNATATPHASSTCYDWTSPTAAYATDNVAEASVVHTLLFGVPSNIAFHHVRDPHMMCLKLGKRHYYEDVSFVSDMVRDKRGKLHYLHDTVTPTATPRWPPVYHGVRVTSSTRCQVEGCSVALGNAKEYYKRHKVCEIHSKAPKVVVSGLLQRFCQQCSRFHDVTQFDEAKRSCRRRLEGHNLRRRKGVVSNSLHRNFPHSHENSSAMEQRLGPLSTSPSPTSSQSKPVRALSLLSSPKAKPWTSSGDLSSRCSAALYELIAANRATYFSRHFLNHNNSQQIANNTMHTSHDTDRFSHTNMTFDVKQAPALDLGLLDTKEKSTDPEEWTDYCWSAFNGSNLV